MWVWVWVWVWVCGCVGVWVCVGGWLKPTQMLSCFILLQWHKAIQLTEEQLDLLRSHDQTKGGDAKALRRLGLLHICCNDLQVVYPFVHCVDAPTASLHDCTHS